MDFNITIQLVKKLQRAQPLRMIVETWDFLCPIFFTNHQAGPCCKVKIKSCCKMGPSTIHRENVNVTKLLKYIVSSFYSFNNQYTIILECPWRRYNIPLWRYCRRKLAEKSRKESFFTDPLLKSKCPILGSKTSSNQKM